MPQLETEKHPFKNLVKWFFLLVFIIGGLIFWVEKIQGYLNSELAETSQTADHSRGLEEEPATSSEDLDDSRMCDLFNCDQYYSASSTTPDCNVVKINLHGFLTTYPDQSSGGILGKSSSGSTDSQSVVNTISVAEKNDRIKMIVLEVDSSGGMPVAGEEIMRAFKDSKKPTVAFIRGVGTSAAYLAATGANTIFASNFSDVGGIGITMSYLDNSISNKRSGQTFNQLSTGEFKDMTNSDKPLTTRERSLIMRDLNIMHNDFVKLVSENRKLDIGKVRKLADGSSMLGKMALDNGLIDKIGLYPNVLEFVSSTIGAEPVVCE